MNNLNNIDLNIYNKPYKHIIINNFLNEKFLKKIIENFPDINNFNNTKRNEQIVNNKSTRIAFYLDNKDNFNKIKNKKIFRKLYQYFNDQIFLKNIFNIFDKKIPENYHLQCQLIYDTKGYNILPHCDNFKYHQHKYLTLLLYLPDNNDLKEYGTELYQENKNGVISFFDKEENKERKFNILKKIPFTKNTLFVFSPEYNKTWHGVSKIKNNIKRRSIQFFLKKKKKIKYEIENSLLNF